MARNDERPKVASKITLSVEVDDGSYVSSVSIPIDSTHEQRNGVVALWLGMMQQAVSLIPRAPVEAPDAD